MTPPTSQKYVRQFIGLVNYYHSMRVRRSHPLAPLTNKMLNKTRFKWNKVKQYALDAIKRIVDCGTLLAYPNFKFIPMLEIRNKSSYQPE